MNDTLQEIVTASLEHDAKVFEHHADILDTTITALSDGHITIAEARSNIEMTSDSLKHFAKQLRG